MKAIQTIGFILILLGGASMDSNFIVACIMAFGGLALILATGWYEGGLE